MLPELTLQFDDNGFLIPYSPVPTNLDTMRRVFVDEFPNSVSRRPIFERYEELNARLMQLIPGGFTQWVDGSFVSRKVNPNDIDVLVFVDNVVHKQHERTFKALRSEFGTGVGRVDVRTILVYPERHRYRNYYESDRVQWLFDWSRTSTTPRLNKGFIQIIIS